MANSSEIAVVESRVLQIVRHHFEMSDVEECTVETKLVDGIGADSLDLVEIIMACEEEWEIEIDDDTSETLFKDASIKDLVTIVVRRIERKIGRQ